MNMFERRVESREYKKCPIPHPLQKTIKWMYTQKVRTYHNSVNNPNYPKNKLNLKDSTNGSKITFTVIGYRITKEFIESCQLVNILHAYRSKNYGPPVIRGLSQLEWPLAWNELKLKYGGNAFCIRKRVAILMNNNFLGDVDDLKEVINTKYVYHVSMDYQKRGIEEFACFVRNSGRSFAYMHISIDDEYIGTFIFMLYTDLAPLTCENFLRLCNARRGGYGGTPVHRIVKGAWIQCGGYSLKSSPLPCENYIVPHDSRGLLCMANDGRHCNNSTQFFVTLQPAEWMDCKYVAFGQLIEGDETLKKVEAVHTRFESPTKRITISRAGILNLEGEEFKICRGALEYMDKHVLNLTEFADQIVEEIIDTMNLQIEFKAIANMKVHGEDGSESREMHATKRFFQRKESIEKTQLDTTISEVSSKQDTTSSGINNSRLSAESLLSSSDKTNVVPEVREYRKIYYPLTDVPYPGESDSDVELSEIKGKCVPTGTLSPPKSLHMSFELFKELSSEEDFSIDSDEDEEIQEYCRLNADQVSFAGDIVRRIARSLAQTNLFSAMQSYSRESAIMAERRSYKTQGYRHASFVSTPAQPIHQVQSDSSSHTRKNTEDNTIVEQLPGDFKKSVRIASSTVRHEAEPSYPCRRKTGFIRTLDAENVRRPSVLTRLIDEAAQDEDADDPKLSDTYRQVHLTPPKSYSHLLTHSSQNRRSLNTTKEEMLLRNPDFAKVVGESGEDILNLRHGPALMRRYSSDYIHSRFMIEKTNKGNPSIRTAEYAKKRPSLTVAEYKRRSFFKAIEKEKSVVEAEEKNVETVMEAQQTEDGSSSFRSGGLHLPGDTPTNSWMDLSEYDSAANDT